MPTPQEISVIASAVAANYGLTRCRDCATALRNAFIRRQIHGQVLRLATVGGRGFIVLKDDTFRLPFPTPPGNPAIATNGFHFGVLVGQQVFDNVFRTGVPYASWQSKFDCDVHRVTLTQIEPF